MNEPRLLIFIRTDLPSMGYGKGAAQSAHASNKFAFKIMRSGQIDDDYEAWVQQSNGQGFGTTITFDAGSNLFSISEMLEQIVPNPLHHGVVTDDTFPYMVDKEVFSLIPAYTHTRPPVRRGQNYMCFRKEVTCGYLFCDEGGFKFLTQQLPMLRND